MTDWIKGNQPSYPGLYWVTVNVSGKIKMYDEPLRYESHKWLLGDKKYYAPNIIAFVECNKPKEPYNEKHIGFPDQYYIKVKGNGTVSYYSKGLQSIYWSKVGYSTKEKALVALKRYEKAERAIGVEEKEYIVVNGNGEEV